jgi:DNA mismatch repair protein MutS
MAKSPMMKQYLQIKEQYEDCILFFRLGDFYEMFYDDAVVASRELELVLTGKQCGEEERAPMCGVPFHASENYIAKLVDRGYKVAVCEQMEDPATAKGLVRREVVQVITPGTVISSSMLSEKSNNYLAACHVGNLETGFAYADISTGEIKATKIVGSFMKERLLNELTKVSPKEIILGGQFEGFLDKEEMREWTQAYVHSTNSAVYRNEKGMEALEQQFPRGIISMGLSPKSADTLALSLLIHYVKENHKVGLSHMRKVKIYGVNHHMALDKATIRNLELTETLYERTTQGSLLDVLDRCHTAMGSRKLKQWIREPLNHAQEIQKRLDAVESLFCQVILRNNFIEFLKGVYDLERLAGRIAMGNANGRDLLALAQSILHLPDMKWELINQENSLLKELGEGVDPLEEVALLIDQAICPDCPLTLKEGGLFQEGYSEELDQLKNSIKDGQHWIASLENQERERTGIKNLKVGFNKVFGYYLEVTKSYYDVIPEDYVRKQTLVNCERFITPQLKEMESIVLGAEAKINELEYRLFVEIREYIEEYIPVIQRTADAISSLDVLCSFAEVATRQNYVKPTVTQGDSVVISKGRHPVIENMLRNGMFVPNDTLIDREENVLLLLTGPNMSGKSTYMRQVALIVLMAQTGSFVPAEKAEIGVCDRIFTRIGASDNLSQGQSTFFVEMSELAYILNNASEHSLILLDEIGRGTSTYDGLSIAWAVAEYLLEDGLKARTLFATHYHEMTALEEMLPGFRNLNVEVKEEEGNIIFLHNIGYGSASRSYGIHVAELAGVPKRLLDRAAEKLKELEEC